MNQNSAFPLVGANTQGNRATTGPAGTAKPSGGKPPGARNYSEFLGSKNAYLAPAGINVEARSDLPLFNHQRVLINWALRRGRCAIFADTGLGKTRMELAWADAIHRETGRDVLILTPLAVAKQMQAEGVEVGIGVAVLRDAADVRPGVNVINYDRLHKIDASRFVGVVLDESSVIKHHNTKTLAALLEAFSRTPYRLCATATPAPNDWTELGTHAEFLGVCTRTEMLAEFFVHDGGETQVWRLKGHAQREFWRWVSQWGAMVRKPSDLGFEDGAYNLPALLLHEHSVESLNTGAGLFALEAASLMERRDARRDSIADRVRACVELVNSDDQPWVVWCDLNAESDLLSRGIEGAIEVRGSLDLDDKESALDAFASGRNRVIVTKPSIAGWGLNWQHCARMAFVGVTDSWESYYQAVRRCWRFGQSHPVQVHIFASEREGSIVANLKRKEQDAQAMAAALSAETREAVQLAVLGTQRQENTYNPARAIVVPDWLRSAA